MAATLFGHRKRSFLYLPDGWDDCWRAAKAASGTTPAWVTLLTDSVGQGAYADNMLTHSWTQLVAANLKARFPTEYAEYWSISDCTNAASFWTPTPRG